jgi:Transcriptional activator, adenine-specific DNA methyltransferase
MIRDLVLLPTAPQALATLAKLRRELSKADTFDKVNDVVRKVRGIQAAWRDVKEVSDEAGRIWVEADAVLGDKLAQYEMPKGGRPANGKTNTKMVSVSLAEIPEVTLKRSSATQKLAAMGETVRKEVCDKLSTIGKAINPATVLAAVRKAAKTEKKQVVAAAIFSADGPFGTVVIDPPWKVEKIDRDVRPNQDAFDYKVMTEDEIIGHFKTEIAPRLEPDCHLFMWTTHKWLPAGLAILEQIGFRYVLTMVWHKAGGFQPIDMPQYNCEFALYARRGSPVFIDTTDFPCCFDGARREHSRKPDRFYEIVRRVTGGSRIDVFSREAREGFAQYGNEIGKFDEAAE